MPEPAQLLGSLADVFTWVGFGAAVAFGILGLVLHLADGTWLPVQGVVEPLDDGLVVRWIDADGTVNEAPLSAHDHERLGGRGMAEVFARRGWRNRMRVTQGSPAVRVFGRLAIGCAVLGLVALVGGWVLLATTG